MSSRSLSDIDGSRKLDAACDQIAKSSQRFDGHKQLVLRDTPWTEPVGFDPDELAHEQSLENRFNCIPGEECVCGSCPDPRTSLEIQEENAVIQKIIAAWAREGRTEGLVLFINHVSEEYGPAFRKRLIHAGVVC